MILLEPITRKEIDPNWLTDYARSELDEHMTPGEDLYLLKGEAPLLIVGVRVWSLTHTPELWVMLCKDYRSIYTRWSKRAVKELLAKYHKLQVWVRTDYPQGRRFALSHGFVGDRVMTLDGVEYENMIARNT